MVTSGSEGNLGLLAILRVIAYFTQDNLCE
jgi:hypothetical protein